MSFDAFQGSGAATSSEPVSSGQEVAVIESSAPETSVVPSESPSESTEVAEWAPNFKFKVHEVEHEMDPYFAQHIKTQEDEKKFRELYEKSFGLDVIKPKFQATRQELEQIKPQLAKMQEDVAELREHYQRGDFDTFFKRLGIPEEKVLRWLVSKAQYNQLPPEQRQVLDENRSANDRAWQAEKQAKEYRQQYEAQVTQAKSQGLQIALEKPEVKSIAAAFDAKQGQPGAFRAEVAKYGDYVWQTSQGRVDLTPEQAVQAVVERLTMFGSPQSGASRPPVVPAETTQSGASKVKSLPNLQGRNTTSVGKSKPKSLADLRKLAENFGQR